VHVGAGVVGGGGDGAGGAGAGAGAGAGGAGAGAGVGGFSPACCWLTVCVRSPMVNVPVRGPPLLAATRNVNVPLPLPSARDVIVSHSALLRAVQAHPFNTEMETLTLLALAATDCVSGASEKRHGAASCMTRNWLSLTTISASRVDGAGFGSARNATVPLPCPDAGEN